jgi:hypothetical protein
MYPTTSSRRSNFPTSPRKQTSNNSFPEDLLAGGRNLYLQIQFVSYSFGYQTFGGDSFFNQLVNNSIVGGILDAAGLPRGFSGAGGVANPVGGISLPVPKKLNETQALTWNEEEAAGILTNLVKPGFLTSTSNFASALTGLRLNPYLFMFFQRPNYKEFSFSWTFAPVNQRESRTLSNIINLFKSNSLPTFGTVTMGYPNIALMKMHPGDVFGNLKFKPCAITSVLVDYSPAGPSFFSDSLTGNSTGRSNGAPTLVNLTVNFKEIQLWDRNEISGFAPGASAPIPAPTPNTPNLSPTDQNQVAPGINENGTPIFQ